MTLSTRTLLDCGHKKPFSVCGDKGSKSLSPVEDLSSYHKKVVIYDSTASSDGTKIRV